MKSILKFLFLLLTAVLILAYSVEISEKIRNPTFKDLSSSDYVWLGMLIVVLLFLNVVWIYSDISNKRQLSSAAVMPNKQHDVFLLARDLNTSIVKGTRGTNLETLGDNTYLIEFVKEDGSSYEFDGQVTFIVDNSYIGEIV